MVVSAFAAIVRSDASAYPFSRNPSFAQDKIRSETPSIGFVPQKGVLFSGTIASNLRFGKDDASDEEIAKAAEIAQATEFIEAKDDKYETPIAQGGSNVSGGQKQRLAIARAILADNKILILVMKDGDIIEQGNHEELLAANGFYANLYNSQFEDVVA